MALGIGEELTVFMHALLAGNLVCLVYEAIRIFRRIIRHTLFWISVEDLLFWIATAIYLFVRIFQTSSGMIRWYFVLGALVGGGLTYYLLEKIAKKYLAKRWEKE